MFRRITGIASPHAEELHTEHATSVRESLGAHGWLARRRGAPFAGRRAELVDGSNCSTKASVLSNGPSNWTASSGFSAIVTDRPSSPISGSPPAASAGGSSSAETSAATALGGAWRGTAGSAGRPTAISGAVTGIGAHPITHSVTNTRAKARRCDVEESQRASLARGARCLGVHRPRQDDGWAMSDDAERCTERNAQLLHHLAQRMHHACTACREDDSAHGVPVTGKRTRRGDNQHRREAR